MDGWTLKKKGFVKEASDGVKAIYTRLAKQKVTYVPTTTTNHLSLWQIGLVFYLLSEVSSYQLKV